MRIFVTGTRGIPSIPGGVESHCEQLYPRISSMGNEIFLSRRTSYVTTSLEQWQGVLLTNVYTPRRKSLEAIIHTTLSIFKAWKWRADIIHIHAIGPALMTPLAKILGMKVVVTNHGPDYERQKWGRLAKVVLRLGEYLGCKYADEVIVISKHIHSIVQKRVNRKAHLIPNGVVIHEIVKEYISSIGVQPKKYILAVARLVPEKGLHDLIDAFELANLNVIKLVIAGDSDHEDKYSCELKNRARNNPDIVMTSYVKGDDLYQLYSHAKLFVLPSYHEGLPISLLEALSYGLSVLVSDIEANTELGLDDSCYFSVGKINVLADKINKRLQEDRSEYDIRNTIEWVQKKYDWDIIADKTLYAYHMAINE